ncbi:class I SAM-dependent methyltransferase [Haloarculaceae archaeon H-GB2-1]|nr:class I SAM-dependent methyltransferase [Haloarculaceae archaeon H-GB1-1]MEA5386076.1 class I SAM-dependent methyltransferase [Haloarculaceae archaeon H-GB11]MEA5407583.1 class I SAM-dependent methyltransferase [Haloarculaceae archaeon H-GB2-1]
MDRFRNTRQPDWDWWGRLWPTPGATIRRLGIGGGDAVVEVGSGNGYFTLPVARITDPAPVYALDLDEELLTELTRLAEMQGIENVEPVHEDARSLSTALPEPVDVVLIANTFHGVADVGSFVREAFEALRPGGRLVVVNWHDRPREETTVAGESRGPPTDLRMTPDETKRAVREGTDFAVAETVDLPPYHYGIVFER